MKKTDPVRQFAENIYEYIEEKLIHARIYRMLNKVKLLLLFSAPLYLCA